MSALLKFRLQRDAVARRIESGLIDAMWNGVLWRDVPLTEEMVQKWLDHVVAQDEWAPNINARIQRIIPDYLTKDAVDLWNACRLVWMYEREWMFPHGFALVPAHRTNGGAA